MFLEGGRRVHVQIPQPSPTDSDGLRIHHIHKGTYSDFTTYSINRQNLKVIMTKGLFNKCIERYWEYIRFILDKYMKV